jgi:hypothetical protein
MIQKGSKHDWARGVAALLIVFIAFGIFLLFYNMQDNILGTSNFYPFMTLTIVGAGFLFGLLYLINKPEKHKKAPAVHKSSKSAKKSKKSKK